MQALRAGLGILAFVSGNSAQAACTTTQCEIGLIDLGTLGGDSSFPNFLSADGSVVFGSASDSLGDTFAFRWVGGKMSALALDGARYSEFSAATADGSVAVGLSEVRIGEAIRYHAFRWTANGMEDLGALKGGSSAARGVSADGKSVVGGTTVIEPDFFRDYAVHWDEAGKMTVISLASGNISVATAWTQDLSVIVGYGNLADLPNNPVINPFHAFRWTMGGGAEDLGTFGGKASAANGLSADGNVVIGGVTADDYSLAFRWERENSILLKLDEMTAYSEAVNWTADASVIVGTSSLGQVDGNGTTHAFRWTKSGGIEDLKTLGGENSVAAFVSKDGSVVVGQSDTDTNDQHAFLWTAAGGMIDLGTLGGSFSGVYQVDDFGDGGISEDGSVVIGYSETAQSPVTGESVLQAFRWENGKMVALALGDHESFASAWTRDMSVVVGSSGGEKGEPHAFRWTSSTGTQDLNTLMSSAGVNMSGITLVYATRLSNDGQWIAGGGIFGEERHAYLLRYIDGVTAGIADQASVQTSVNDLSSNRTGVIAQQNGLMSPLLGNDRPFDTSNEAGGFAAYGSAMAGGFARLSNGNGLSLLAGMSWAQEDFRNAELNYGVSGAAALRYQLTGVGPLSPFFETGGWLTRNASLEFSRDYANGAGIATGHGKTSGDIDYRYGRAGLIADLTKADQVVVAGEYGRERMRVGGYREQLTAQNPFNAEVSAGSDILDIAKVRVQWTHRLNPVVDTTLWAAGAIEVDWSTSMETTVAGFGTLTPTAHQAARWAEYGARVGYKITSETTIDAFVTGVSGEASIGTRVHGGFDVRFQF